MQIEGQHDGQDGSDGVGENAAMAFPGMPMGGDMNQMQMFMAMQNGMGAGGFGNFPMMGKCSQLYLKKSMLTGSQVCQEWEWIQ